MDAEVKREIIMEHYQNPLNKDKIIGEGYEKVNSANSSCIDNIDIYILIKDNIIKDICFTGEACAISISSTSIMIKNLIGKTVNEAKEYKERVKFSGTKHERETHFKHHNDKMAVKISVQKRQSARNTQKQSIHKEIHEEK